MADYQQHAGIAHKDSGRSPGIYEANKNGNDKALCQCCEENKITVISF
jgi:hypothetical protein